jgi:hypothetical protein
MSSLENNQRTAAADFFFAKPGTNPRRIGDRFVWVARSSNYLTHWATQALLQNRSPLVVWDKSNTQVVNQNSNSNSILDTIRGCLLWRPIRGCLSWDTIGERLLWRHNQWTSALETNQRTSAVDFFLEKVVIGRIVNECIMFGDPLHITDNLQQFQISKFANSGFRWLSQGQMFLSHPIKIVPTGDLLIQVWLCTSVIFYYFTFKSSDWLRFLYCFDIK